MKSGFLAVSPNHWLSVNNIVMVRDDFPIEEKNAISVWYQAYDANRRPDVFLLGHEANVFRDWLVNNNTWGHDE